MRFTSLLERVLALRAASAAAAPGADGRAPEASPAPAAAPAALLRAADAAKAIDGWLGETATVRLGVATASAADTLFAAEEQRLAVAGPGATGRGGNGAARPVLARLLDSAYLAAADAKALLGVVCPPDEALACVREPRADDGDRLFDCAVAAYLLESGRSSYELSALAADYLGAVLPGRHRRPAEARSGARRS